MSRWMWVGVAVAAAVLLFLLLRPSRPPTPEARIRAALERAAHAVEERKAGEVAELLSPRFQGEAGGERISRDDARRLVAFEVMRGQWVSASITGANVAVEGSRARARVHAVLSRSTDRSKGLSSLLPTEASAHEFRLDLAEEEAGEWRVVAAGWKAISLEEALSGPSAPDW